MQAIAREFKWSIQDQFTVKTNEGAAGFAAELENRLRADLDKAA
jgi:hypothetical protein